jgi:hypothetical protein
VSSNRRRLGFAVVSAILVLWDIDHTLIENHGVNKEIYALAFKLLTGREAEHRARTDGRTEPEVMRDMLTLQCPGGDLFCAWQARLPVLAWPPQRAARRRAAIKIQRRDESELAMTNGPEGGDLPPNIDFSRPHTARMYDYLLGGYFL